MMGDPLTVEERLELLRREIDRMRRRDDDAVSPADVLRLLDDLICILLRRPTP